MLLGVWVMAGGPEGQETWIDRMFPDRDAGVALLKGKRKTKSEIRSGYVWTST